MTNVLASVASTAVIAALIAAAASVLTLALAAAVRRFAQRPRVGAEERLTGILHELEQRMERMGRELAAELERAREETRRSRILGELTGSIDLDEVLRRTLDAAGGLPGVDAALVTVMSPEGGPQTAAIGLSDEEAADHALGPPPTGRRVRAMTIAYAPRADSLAGEASPIRLGLAVPLPTDVAPIGLLSVFSRDERRGFSDDLLEVLEDLAVRAGPAIENARRFHEARQLADHDALTGLYNRRYFHETLAREVARARRYDRRLTLVVFDLDDFKTINDQIGHLAGDTVLAQVAERVNDVVRSADIACRIGGDEFGIILPESTLEDADQLTQRLQTHVSARPVAQAGRLFISAGIAELRPQDDAVSFFQRADDALYRAKEAGKGRIVAATGAVGPAPVPPQEGPRPAPTVPELSEPSTEGWPSSA